jgi:hypothetical protein
MPEAAPVTTAAPAPTTGLASPSPAPAQPATSRTSRSYGTGKPQHGLRPVFAQPAAAAQPPAATPRTPDAAPAAPLPEESPTVPELPKRVKQGDPPATPAPVSEGAPTPPAAAEAPASGVDELEAAKRMATIARAEGKLAGEKRQHASRLSIADAVNEVFGADNASPQTIRQAGQQLRLISQGRQLAAQDPIGYLHRVFGVDPRTTIQKAIDMSIGDAGKTAEMRATETAAAATARVAQLQQQIQEGETRNAQAAAQRQVSDYQTGTIAPILADKAAFKHLHHLCEMNGTDPVRELYAAMVETYQRTKTAPDPLALARKIEDTLTARYQKLNGPSAKADQPATPKRVVPPQAAAPGTQRESTAEPARRQKIVAKPYSTSRMT